MIYYRQRLCEFTIQDFLRYLNGDSRRSPEMFKEVKEITKIAKQAIHKSIESLPCKIKAEDSKSWDLSKDIYSHDEDCLVLDILARASSSKDCDLVKKLADVADDIVAYVKSSKKDVSIEEIPTRISLTYPDHPFSYSQIDICPDNYDSWRIIIRLAGFTDGDITATIFIHFPEELSLDV